MIYNSLIPRFKSNNWDSGLGFQIEYESSDVTQWSYNIGACGGNFTTPNGILTSPDYPGYYPNNADCIYTISQHTGTVIQLNFSSMDISKSLTWSDSCNDHLEIRDGPQADSPLLTNKLCGNEIPAPLQSSQNQLWMK